MLHNYYYYQKQKPLLNREHDSIIKFTRLYPTMSVNNNTVLTA